jgi:hypothetical protein
MPLLNEVDISASLHRQILSTSIKVDSMILRNYIYVQQNGFNRCTITYTTNHKQSIQMLGIVKLKWILCTFLVSVFLDK